MTERLTITVPEAAELLGLGRSAAYEAAKSGELPTLKFGRRLLVPVAHLERMLGMDQSGRDETPSSTQGASIKSLSPVGQDEGRKL